VHTKVIDWLGTLPTFAAAFIVIGGFVFISIVIGFLVVRFTSSDVRTAHNDRAGFILAVIGVIYAVLLAFVAVGAWERFQQAEARTYEEAESLAEVYRDAGSFVGGEALRRTLRAYVESVINVSWPAMRSGETSDIVDALLEKVDRQVRALPATSPRLEDIHAQMLSAMDTALADRESRVTMDSTGINGIMWMVLVIGAFITVAFTYLFGFDRTIMQALMVGALSFMIALVLFLIAALDYPFRGSIAVSPEAFQALLESLKVIGS
jgi:Protein of unknown function (DUF4239)